MKKGFVIAGLAGLLLFSGSALADEAKKDEHAGHGTTHVQPAAKQEPAKTAAPTQTPATADPHGAHNMTPDEHKNMPTTTTDSHEESSGGGGHGHGSENVVETPPNVPVLAAFGAVNAAFLLFGIWNKWLSKKEVLA